MLNPSHRKYYFWFEVLFKCGESAQVLSHSLCWKKVAFHLIVALLPVSSVIMSHFFLKRILTERLCVAGITLGEDGVLTIERVKKDDEGLYECIAKNVEGIAKTSAVVTVLGKSFTPIKI